MIGDGVLTSGVATTSCQKKKGGYSLSDSSGEVHGGVNTQSFRGIL